MRKPEQRSRLTPQHQPEAQEKQDSKQDYRHLGSMPEVFGVVDRLFKSRDFKAMLNVALANYFASLSNPYGHLGTLRDVSYIRQGVLDGICKTVRCMGNQTEADAISDLCMSVRELAAIAYLAAQAKLKQDAAAAASPEFQADVMDDSQVGSQPDPNELT